MPLVAVYGTLKRNRLNHYVLDAVRARFISEALTKEKFPLISDGLIPYLFDVPGEGHQVKVEIYDVNDRGLMLLDQMEQHPVWYRRKLISLVPRDGSRKWNPDSIEAWVYFTVREQEVSFFQALHAGGFQDFVSDY